MSSLFDVPAQLALVLSLAASAAGPDAPTPHRGAEPALIAGQTISVAEPLAGPFRFSESAWLRALKESGPSSGVGAGFSARVFKTSGGRFYVPAISERSEILDARWDVAVASRVARAFAQLNARRMRPALGRSPTSGDLYLAHLFGPEAAVSFIALAKLKPNDLAAEHFSGLLETEPDALFDDGQPVTVAKLYERFTRPLRERRTPAQVSVGHAQDNAHASAALPLKPTLMTPEPRDIEQVGSLAFAWRSKVIGVQTAVPVQ